MRWIKWGFRKAEEKPTKEVPAGLTLFTVAGKPYSSLKELIVKKKHDKYLYEDIYGREWAYETDRYPCFDSSDYLYEDRYYRWFVYRDGEDLWQVYYDDGTKQLEVTKNPEHFRYDCRKMLSELGWIE